MTCTTTTAIARIGTTGLFRGHVVDLMRASYRKGGVVCQRN